MKSSTKSVIALNVLFIFLNLLHADDISRYGVNAHLANALALDSAVEAGIGWVRIDMHWDEIEPSEEKDINGNKIYHFDAVRNMINRAKSKGLSIIGGFCDVPDFYNNGFKYNDTGVYFPSHHIQDWTEFLHAVVTEFENDIIYWCVWNEPNIEPFWNAPGTGSLLERADAFFTNVFIPGIATIDSINSNLKICGPDTSSSGDNYSAKYFIGRMFAIKPDIDVIFHHQYNSDTVSEFINKIEDMHVYLSGIGKGNVPFWVTETSVGEAGSNGITQKPDCLYKIMNYMENQSFVKKIFWYALIADLIEKDTALVSLDTNLKYPLWYAYRYAIQEKPEKPISYSPMNNGYTYTTTPTMKWTRDFWGHYEQNLTNGTRVKCYQLQLLNNANACIYEKHLYQNDWLWDNNYITHTIPSGVLELNKTYKWKVRAVNINLQPSDWSNINSFSTITPSITVNTPNGGEIWVRGTTQTITWSVTQGIEYIKMQLLNGSTVVSTTLPSSYPASIGSYSWTVPKLGGNTFRIRISTTDLSVTDTSNNGFTISISAPNPPTQTGKLLSGQGLGLNKYILSSDNRFKLVMQNDGNLVLYKIVGGTTALWSSKTNGQQAYGAYMQADGNFVIYNCIGTSLWASRTSGNPNSQLKLQTDGNCVIYNSQNIAKWSTKTGGQ